MENWTDEQLVKSYLKGQEACLEMLLQRHMPGLFNFVFKYTHNQSEAEDVTQEAFVKIWKNLKKFNPKYKFKTWAYTIAKNTALDSLKKKGFTALTNDDKTEDVALSKALVSPDPLPEQLMMSIDDAGMVNRAMQKLPPKYRQVIDLYYHGQFNFREIAGMLKESINTIKTRHRRAVIHLKKEISEK